MDTQPLIGQEERIDDLPLLIGLMGRRKLAEVLDKHLGRHHLHPGLSNGQLAVGWIAYIRSQSGHRQYAVQDWAVVALGQEEGQADGHATSTWTTSRGRATRCASIRCGEVTA
jgi:hypothetical protein